MCESDDTCCTGTCDIATLFPLPKPFGRRLFFLRNTGKSLLLPPFAAHPSPSGCRGLRGCGTASQCPHPSVLRTLFSACLPPYGGSQASPLRWRFAPCSRLGALHPSLRPTPLRVVGFGAAVLLRSVLTPRCFAPFFGLPPHLRWCVGFAAALPRLTSESACVFRSQFSAEPSRRFSAFGV